MYFLICVILINLLGVWVCKMFLGLYIMVGIFVFWKMFVLVLKDIVFVLFCCVSIRVSVLVGDLFSGVSGGIFVEGWVMILYLLLIVFRLGRILVLVKWWKCLSNVLVFLVGKGWNFYKNLYVLGMMLSVVLFLIVFICIVVYGGLKWFVGFFFWCIFLERFIKNVISCVVVKMVFVFLCVVFECVFFLVIWVWKVMIFLWVLIIFIFVGLFIIIICGCGILVLNVFVNFGMFKYFIFLL